MRYKQVGNGPERLCCREEDCHRGRYGRNVTVEDRRCPPAQLGLERQSVDTPQQLEAREVPGLRG